MMSFFKATREDVIFLEQYAETWELNETKVFIRENIRVVNHSISLLGFDNNGLRTMPQEMFDRFLEIKDKEE